MNSKKVNVQIMFYKSLWVMRVCQRFSSIINMTKKSEIIVKFILSHMYSNGKFRATGKQICNDVNKQYPNTKISLRTAERTIHELNQYEVPKNHRPLINRTYMGGHNILELNPVYISTHKPNERVTVTLKKRNLSTKERDKDMKNEHKACLLDEKKIYQQKINEINRELQS